jgi:alpha-L-rhamnosidase
MGKFIVILLVALFLIAGCAKSKKAVEKPDALAVTGLRCEYQDNPLGIDAVKPRLSWMITSNRRGILQDAYQVLVASSLETLNADNGDIWDSGKVNSRQSIQVVYQGKPLSSGRRYFWKVRVWDQEGGLTAYSQPAGWEMGLLQPGDWKGKWIEPRGGIKGIKFDFETPDPARLPPNLFRKSFPVKDSVRSARLYVTGLGSYVIKLNGTPVSDAVLAPGHTVYDKTMPYQSYDVTPQIRTGDNILAAVIGNGLRFGRNPQIDARARQILVQLNLTYADGRQESIVSDETWKCTLGPLLVDHLFFGEIYDARREIAGWDRAGFADREWQATAPSASPPKGVLVAQRSDPIKVIETITPVKITTRPEGITIYDLGQNIAGWTRIKIKGAPSSRVKLRYAELLDKEGNPDFTNIRGYGYIQTDSYTCKGDGLEVWEPQFTYHGFRYIEASHTGDLRIEAIEGRAVHSAVARTGEFICSNPLLNRIQQNVTRGIQDNLHDIPTDCCQRAERSGWGGDAQVMAETACLNFGMGRFYSKWLGDFLDDQRPDGGVYDNVPWTGWGGFGAPGWHDCYITIAMAVYQNYGDTRVIAEQYEGMKRAVDFILAANPNFIWEKNTGGNYADWGSPIADKEHKDLLATCNFYRAAWSMAQMAGAINNKEGQAYYTEMAAKIKKALNERFFDKKSGNYAGGAQAANAFPLFLQIVPEGYAGKVVENLVADIKKQDYHLTTGPQGTRYVMQALRMYGQDEVAYKLATQTTMPSWGYMIANGATTVWEFWNGDHGISHNHPFLGSVSEWFYKALAGINQEPGSTGYEKIIIQPSPAGDLIWAKASLKTVRGLVSSEWERNNDLLRIEIDIPGNSTATVHIPKIILKNFTITEKGKTIWKNDSYLSGVAGITGGNENDAFVIFTIGSGNYSFELKSLLHE